MTGHALMDIGPARRIAGLQAAVFAVVCLAFGAVLLQLGERRRTLARANAQLETRVAERTAELSETNIALRREVSERKDAEAALKKAQTDLVQAGKLSALGQMSAGISHELNQPLMAIRQYADNGAAFLEKDRPEDARDNLSRISQLAARAARIIKNLRAFARNESEPMGKVDLVQVIDTAVELTQTRLADEGIVLDWTPPAAPVFAIGGEVRLGQVFVNLINNAADAMSGQHEKRITITLEGTRRPVVTVRDTGPGIADPGKIFEPFYSTKEVGSEDGMGLGLSISYGLVQSFGGNIRGVNAAGGGAVFTVELEDWREEAAA
jgi:two-component system C4-dicarboxylate transport sensor histidine kinase DctB